jgi:hypothetical protein
MVFGFIPECRSASLRNQRSAPPESSAWKEEWEKRQESIKTVEDLHKQIADNGPRITLRFDKTEAHEGLFVQSDQPVACLSVERIESNQYVLINESIGHMAEGKSMPLILESQLKGSSTRDVSPSFVEMFEDYCGLEIEQTIPLDIEYWDMRGNKFNVRWLVVWHTIEIRMGIKPKIRYDPTSYRATPHEVVRQ